jgi:carbon storage regulator
MLVLTRRESETIRIGKDIVITVVRITGQKVRIGITAPQDVSVLRGELEDFSSTAQATHYTTPTKSSSNRPNHAGMHATPGRLAPMLPQLVSP